MTDSLDTKPLNDLRTKPNNTMNTEDKIIKQAKKEATLIFNKDNILGTCNPYPYPNFERIKNALKKQGLDTSSDCEENIKLAFAYHRAFIDEYRTRYFLRYSP